MTKMTEQVLNGWMEQNAGKVIQPSRYVSHNGQNVSWQTVRRYIQLEKVVERTYYTMREVVDMLNECSGEDCYGGEWHYEIDEQGRVYSDDVVGFKVIGWK